MKCTNCAQASDWGRDGSDWTTVNPEDGGIHRLYECDRCGHRQLNR